MHTCVHGYIHTCVHASMHACMRAYIPPSIHACRQRQTDERTHGHTHVHERLRVDIYYRCITCIYAYYVCLRIYIYINIHILHTHVYLPYIHIYTAIYDSLQVYMYKFNCICTHPFGHCVAFSKSVARHFLTILHDSHFTVQGSNQSQIFTIAQLQKVVC